MTSSAAFLSPADAARRLGVSAKALRLYEERGLLAPGRTSIGWRAYAPAEMERASAIVALRNLGLSLTQISLALDGNADGVAPALAAHQSTLESRLQDLTSAIGRVRDLRDRIDAGIKPMVAELVRLQPHRHAPITTFDLPWPWGGESFELREMRAVTWIVGPLGSGKTRLAERLAQTIPGGAFIGLDRAANGAPQAQLAADTALRNRVDRRLAWLIEDGATESDALLALLVALESDGPAVLIFDLIEQGLDEATQLALSAHLRHPSTDARPIFAMTRSSAMLDIASVSADEAIILCPANHRPPTFVAPHTGAQGYEAVATCLATPDVRARTEGVIAWRAPAA